MLILLRSDFRAPGCREAFTRLMRHAHVDTGVTFEVPVLEAPQPNALVVRIRKVQAKRDAVLVVGTAKGETLAESLRVVQAVRDGVPYLAIFPMIVLARASEWATYEQVVRAGGSIECFEVRESKTLVLVQSESYAELTHRLVLAYLLPAARVGSGRPHNDQATAEFRIGDRSAGSIGRITDAMLDEAGIEGSLDPQRDRATRPPPPGPPPTPDGARKKR
jgi:hypothetical protein